MKKSNHAFIVWSTQFIL